jgi:hypothetical protein
MTPDEAAVVRELLDAEEANRLEGPTMPNQSRLFRARRRAEDALAAVEAGR